MHLCSCYEKRNLNLHGLINNKYFSDKFLILKFLFSELELEQFYSSLSSSSEELFFEFKFDFAALLYTTWSNLSGIALNNRRNNYTAYNAWHQNKSSWIMYENRVLLKETEAKQILIESIEIFFFEKCFVCATW